MIAVQTATVDFSWQAKPESVDRRTDWKLNSRNAETKSRMNLVYENSGHSTVSLSPLVQAPVLKCSKKHLQGEQQQPAEPVFISLSFNRQFRLHLAHHIIICIIMPKHEACPWTFSKKGFSCVPFFFFNNTPVRQSLHGQKRVVSPNT